MTRRKNSSHVIDELRKDTARLSPDDGQRPPGVSLATDAEGPGHDPADHPVEPETRQTGDHAAERLAEVAERRQLEEDLRASRLQLADAAELAKMAYWEYDLASGEFIFNDPFYELFATTALREGGYRMVREEYTKRFVHPDDWAALDRKAHENRIRDRVNQVAQYEHKAIRRDGEVIYILTRNRLRFDKNGRTLGLVGVNQDITSRKKVEEALREYERIVEGSPDMMTIIDREYRYRVVNSTFLAYRGLERNDVISRSVPDILGKDLFDQRVKKNLDRCFEGKLVQFETKDTYPKLGERNLFISYLPIQGVEGVDRVAAILQDVTESKKADRALKKSERRYQTLFETVRDGFISVGIGGRIDGANPAFLGMIGYGEEELLNLTYGELTPKRWHALEENIIRGQVLTRGYSDVYMIEYIRKDGTLFPAEIRAHLLTDDEGRSTGIWAFVRDVTERAEAEEALRQSEERYRSLFSGMTEGFALHELICDEKGRPSNYRFLDLNPAFEQLTGFKRGDLLGRMMKDVMPGVKDYWIETGGEVALTGKPAHFEMFAAPAGKHFEVYAYRPAPRQFAVLFTDITERKEAQKQLEEKEERFRKVFEESPIGIVMVGPDHRFVRANTAFCAMLGYTEQELTALTFEDITHPEHVAEDVVRVEELLGGKTSQYRTEKRYLRKDKEIVWGSTTVTVGRDENGKFMYFLTMVENISQRKKAEGERSVLEEQLRQAQKMEAVGTLAGGVAHDFNNILTVIMGLGNLMQMKLGTDSPQRPYVDQIVASSERAAELTRSLLAFSRKQRISLQPHTLNGTVTSTAKLLARLLHEDIGLIMNLTDEDTSSFLDVTQMGQVLMNLATNARDAMPQGGTLTITTARAKIDESFERAHGFGLPGEYVKLSVSDTGTGMDEATMRQIFEPFFTTKEVGKGTGLGLASAYGIIKQHKGYIIVSSELSRGTTFDIYLPSIETSYSQESPDVEEVRGGSETILIVDDDEDVRYMLAEILENNGYTTIKAVDGDDAIRAHQEHGKNIDLIILDVVMPGRSGKEAFDQIRHADPGVKALFVSGYTGDVVIDKGVHSESTDFLHKPISVTGLLSKVREVLDRSRSLPSLQ